MFVNRVGASKMVCPYKFSTLAIERSRFDYEHKGFVGEVVLCISNECMAWRWVSITEGYCSLCGDVKTTAMSHVFQIRRDECEELRVPEK